MNLYGWIFMLGSWAGIIGLFGFCMVRTFSTRKRKTETDDR
jgi:hypothetical protein